MVIYTKKGDKGKTGLFSSTKQKRRVAKNSLTIEALGALDELNSFLGVARVFNDDVQKDLFLRGVQNNLFAICSILAGAKLKFKKTETTKLEKEVDRIDAQLPRLTNFVFAEGSPLAVHLMYSRSLARRAERRVVALHQEKRVPPAVLTYLNRLSDTLFMAFREANFKAGRKEITWKGQD